jgi:hypothetical protein
MRHARTRVEAVEVHEACRSIAGDRNPIGLPILQRDLRPFANAWPTLHWHWRIGAWRSGLAVAGDSERPAASVKRKRPTEEGVGDDGAQVTTRMGVGCQHASPSVAFRGTSVYVKSALSTVNTINLQIWPMDRTLEKDPVRESYSQADW